MWWAASSARSPNGTSCHTFHIVTTRNLINHSFYHYLSAQTYGKEHPEYFSLLQGERKLDVGGGGPELCLTHPDVLQIVTRTILDAIKDIKDTSKVDPALAERMRPLVKRFLALCDR